MATEQEVYAEKLIRLLEETFDVTRTENYVTPVKCCFCHSETSKWIKIGGKVIGYDCMCPENLFVLLTTFDVNRMTEIAKKCGLQLTITETIIKEISLRTITPLK